MPLTSPDLPDEIGDMRRIVILDSGTGEFYAMAAGGQIIFT
jgi:hypothetical protein